MADEITTLKWAAGLVTFITGLLSMPFAWIHVRQNRFEDGMIRISDAAKAMSDCVARMETHQEHMREDIKEIKIAQEKRRDEFKRTDKDL